MLVVLDGPMGTELARRGVDLEGPAWTARALVERPDAVAGVHRDYVAAGATVHTTCTFRARARTAGPGWGRLVERAVALARGSVPPHHRVAGSIAPVQDCYRPDLSPGLASRPEHRALARRLAASGVDILLCEAFACPGEATVAVEEAARTGIETWAALTAGPDGDLLSPKALAHAARDCITAGARVVLVSCVAATRTAAYVDALAPLGVPFGAYANAGAPSDAIGWDADDVAGARIYASLAQTWIAAGATVIGGCCGTLPAHIAELSRLRSDA